MEAPYGSGARVTVRLPSEHLEALNRKLANEQGIPASTFFRHVVAAYITDNLTIKRTEDKLYER